MYVNIKLNSGSLNVSTVTVETLSYSSTPSRCGI